MIHKISEKAIMYAIHNNYIKQEQYDEYVYALEIILNILITDITMIIIGLAMGMIWECILFWLVYKILRKYCGGYHFSTSLKCYLSSCIMCPVVLAVVRYVPYSMTVYNTAGWVCVKKKKCRYNNRQCLDCKWRSFLTQLFYST